MLRWEAMIKTFYQVKNRLDMEIMSVLGECNSDLSRSKENVIVLNVRSKLQYNTRIVDNNTRIVDKQHHPSVKL